MEERKKDWKFRTLLISGFGIFIYMIISIMNVIGSFFSPDNVFWFDPLTGSIILIVIIIAFIVVAIKYIKNLFRKTPEMK